MASNRIIREQFSEGTTVDGSRIQGALDTVEGRINAVPRGDILPRYAEQTIHLGFMPGGMGSYFIYPWGPLYNLPNWVTAGGSDKVVNTVRIKGCYNANIASTSGDQFVWSTGVHHVAPCIVNELHFNAVTDSVFINALTDNAIHLLIGVNADGEGQDRHLNSFEAVKHLISDDAWPFRRTSAAPTADMDPAHTETLAGNIISFKNLGVAIPAGARVLYQVVIPSNVGAWVSPRPWQTIIPGMTVHYLEEIV